MNSACAEPTVDIAGFSPAPYRCVTSRGNIVRWYGTATDIEDRKRAEMLLAGEKRLLEMIARGEPLARSLDACAGSSKTCPRFAVLDPVAGSEGEPSSSRRRPESAAALRRGDRWHSHRPNSRVVWDRGVSRRTGDRVRYRTRSALGRLPRSRARLRTACLLVDADTLIGRHGAGDVRDLLS